MLVKQNSTKKSLFCTAIFIKQKFSNLRPHLSITFPQGFQKYLKKKKVWTLDFKKWGQKYRELKVEITNW